MKLQYPVVVIGAGPAGASAVYTLASLGVEPIVWIDRFELGRPKACAGGLGPRALKWLSKHGLLDEVRSFARPVGSLRFVSPNGKSALLPSGMEAALVAPRTTFDAFMVSVAKGEGARLETKTSATYVSKPDGAEDYVVVGTSSGDEIAASFVLVATGAVDSITGIERPESTVVKTILVRFDGFPHTPDTIEMIFDLLVLPYYAWLFPEPEGSVNIGLMAGTKASKMSLHEALDEILHTHFRSRMKDATQIGKRMGAPIRTSSKVGKIVQHGGRVWLLGEAAALVNPATGEGIPYALESGELAAYALHSFASSSAKIASRAYVSAVRKRFGLNLRLASYFVDFAGSRAFPIVADAGTSQLFRRFTRKALSEV